MRHAWTTNFTIKHVFQGLTLLMSIKTSSPAKQANKGQLCSWRIQGFFCSKINHKFNTWMPCLMLKITRTWSTFLVDFLQDFPHHRISGNQSSLSESDLPGPQLTVVAQTDLCFWKLDSSTYEHLWKQIPF